MKSRGLDGLYRDPDMLLGIDYFLSHRLYVSRSQRRIYATWNGGRVFRRNGSGNGSEQPRQHAGHSLRESEPNRVRPQDARHDA